MRALLWPVLSSSIDVKYFTQLTHARTHLLVHVEIVAGPSVHELSLLECVLVKICMRLSYSFCCLYVSTTATVNRDCLVTQNRAVGTGPADPAAAGPII